MKPKLNPLFLIIGLFLFKVGIVDNLRFTHSNSEAPKGERRIASIEDSRRAIR
jgi:hypothetical protein